MLLPADQQLSFQLPKLTLKAQAWGNPSGKPVLALHGWLDNCASFFRLAPPLSSHCYVVALDMAGHGLSDHRGVNQPYNIWEDVGEIFAVADQLGWREFTLLGHSRGAIVSTLAAGTFPERISHLALLDGMLPKPVAADRAAEQLASSITDCRRHRFWPSYDSLEPMIKARTHGFWSLSQSAAEALVTRGSEPTEQGYRWTADPLLRAASAVRLSEAHLQSFVQRIRAKTLVFEADQGALAQADSHSLIWPDTPTYKITGSHHCHMEEQAGEIASQLKGFWS